MNRWRAPFGALLVVLLAFALVGEYAFAADTSVALVNGQQTPVPVKYHDNGDGTYSQVTYGGGAGSTTLYADNGSGTPVAVQSGDVNNAASASGDVKALAVCRYNATLPTLTDTRYNACQVGTRGGLQVNIVGADSTQGQSVSSNTVDARSDSVGRAITESSGMGFNGTTWDRLRTGSASVLSGTSGTGALVSTHPGNWSVTHGPAANTQATIAKTAGGAGVRHVATSISASYASNGTAATPAFVTLSLRDGACGSGTVVWSHRLSVTATGGAGGGITLGDLNIVGTANTDMCLEFSGAGGANTVETVALTGYSAS